MLIASRTSVTGHGRMFSFPWPLPLIPCYSFSSLRFTCLMSCFPTFSLSVSTLLSVFLLYSLRACFHFSLPPLAPLSLPFYSLFFTHCFFNMKVSSSLLSAQAYQEKRCWHRRNSPSTVPAVHSMPAAREVSPVRQNTTFLHAPCN